MRNHNERMVLFRDEFESDVITAEELGHCTMAQFCLRVGSQYFAVFRSTEPFLFLVVRHLAVQRRKEHGRMEADRRILKRKRCAKFTRKY